MEDVLMKKIPAETKIYGIKNILILLILILIINLGKYITKNTNTSNSSNPSNPSNPSQDMELTFLGLGEADSILIRHDNKILLIDTGETKDSEYIIKAILDLGVKKIDYLILTHPDKDHIGGALDIIKYLKVGEIIQSSFQKGSELQAALNEEINRRKIPVTIPEKEYEFNMGEVKVKVSGPEEDEYKKSNNYSLVTLLTHGKLNYFFAGDAEKKRLEEILKYDLPEMALYKVPHHGRNNKKSSEIIEKLSPEIAIITSSEADKKVLAALLIMNTKVYYTADKTIRFISDGIDLREH